MNTSRQTFKTGQRVYWNYPHDDLVPGEYEVQADYPPEHGSGSYVMVAKSNDFLPLPALPEELTLLPADESH